MYLELSHIGETRSNTAGLHITMENVQLSYFVRGEFSPDLSVTIWIKEDRSIESYRDRKIGSLSVKTHRVNITYPCQ